MDEDSDVALPNQSNQNQSNPKKRSLHDETVPLSPNKKQKK